MSIVDLSSFEESMGRGDKDTNKVADIADNEADIALEINGDNELNLALTQLHPNGKRLRCFLGLIPTPPIFLHYFCARPNFKKCWVYLIFKKERWLFTLYATSFKGFKTKYFKVGITEVGRPKFPLYLIESPIKIASWNKSTITTSKVEVVNLIDQLSRHLNSRSLVNCRGSKNLYNEVFDTMASHSPKKNIFKKIATQCGAKGSETSSCPIDGVVTLGHGDLAKERDALTDLLEEANNKVFNKHQASFHKALAQAAFFFNTPLDERKFEVMKDVYHGKLVNIQDISSNKYVEVESNVEVVAEYQAAEEE
ncbi:hypothetical protein LR48_Vigan10g236600 [Vigna angularis]|uniref:Uncharacterized protein n=1 Tax=Phaseolus angularis TaxID=3914 RepID=A0A0L9VP24_PHAAN|nr:hypothetical protein LR48_Vigan10g236600 [Vigna angularis]